MAEGQGCFIAIVGPSGSGKDTLINWLKPRLAHARDVMFVRRAVTRDADTAAEDHHALDREAFAAEERAGRYAVAWDAHGLRYGIPAAALQHVAGGGIAIANGSRRALADIEAAFGNLLVVCLTVDPAVLAERLAGRGRETPDEIARRLARRDEALPAHCRVLGIDNTGPVENAGGTFLQMLEAEFGITQGAVA